MLSLKVNDRVSLDLLDEANTKEAYDLVMANYAHLYEWSHWVNEDFSIASVEEYYDRALKKFAEKGDELGLNIMVDGKIAGTTGFHEINRRDKAAEIGYWLAKAHTGQGLVTECTKRLIDYGFNEMGLNRIVIKCAPENLKSRAISERLGFTFEGIERDGGWLHDRFVDHVVYSMLLREWRCDLGK